MVDIKDQIVDPRMRGVSGQTKLDEQANRLQREITRDEEDRRSPYGRIPRELTPEQARQMMEDQHAAAAAKEENNA